MIRMSYRMLCLIPFMKKNLHKSGLSSFGEVEKFMSNINTDYTRGSCLRLAMSFMTFFLGFGTVGVLNTLKLFFIKVEIDSDVKSLIILMELFLLAFPMGFYFLWRKDKYLTYFKRFEKEPKRKTRKWCLITVVIYIAILVLFFWSLRWFSIQLPHWLFTFISEVLITELNSPTKLKAYQPNSAELNNWREFGAEFLDNFWLESSRSIYSIVQDYIHYLSIQTLVCRHHR